MRPITMCALLVTLAVAGATAAPLIVITATGVPAGENLVANPGFEQGAGEWPDGWSWAGNQPTGVVREWSDRALTGERSAVAISNTAAGSGYWTQRVAVEPDTVYLLTVRAIIEGGKVLVRALGVDEADANLRFDKRAYDEHLLTHPLVPGFWKPEWVVGMVREDWAPVDLVFDTFERPVPAAVIVHAGSYFAPGRCWFDEAYLGPGTLTLRWAVSQAAFRRVRLLGAEGNELVTSGELPEGTMQHKGELESLPLIGPWCVEVTDAGGEVTRQWYPAPPKEGE